MRLSWSVGAVVGGAAAAAAASGDGIEAAVLNFKVADHIEEAKAVFKRLPSEADGTFYTLADFKRMMNSSGVDQKLLLLTFQRDDADGDGQVTFDEYSRWFTRGNLFLQLDGSLPGTERDGLVSRDEFMVFVRFDQQLLRLPCCRALNIPCYNKLLRIMQSPFALLAAGGRSGTECR
jgi:hypothetical protein